MNADLSWDMWGISTKVYGSVEVGYDEIDISKMRFQIRCPRCGRLYGIRRSETSRIADIFTEYEDVILTCSPFRGGCGMKSEISTGDIIDTRAKTTNTKW
jgi:hypothetical protein